MSNPYWRSVMGKWLGSAGSWVQMARECRVVGSNGLGVQGRGFKLMARECRVAMGSSSTPDFVKQANLLNLQSDCQTNNTDMSNEQY